MSLFEWLTLLVALAVGFGGAMLGGRIQRKQAEAQRLHDEKQAQRQERERRRNALLDYERALLEQVLSIEGYEWSTSTMPAPKDLHDTRKAAYPYFSSLRESENEDEKTIFWRLIDPGAGEHQDAQDAIAAYSRAHEAVGELIKRTEDEDRRHSS